MFNLSDDDLEGIESRNSRPASGEAFRPPPFGADPGGAVPPAGPGPMPIPNDVTPAPAPAVQLAPPPMTSSATSGAGKALLFVTGGLVVGAIAGGAWGAAAGVVGVGAMRNMARVRALWNSPVDAERSEAGKSATMAIFGIGIAGMLGYQAYKAKTKTDYEESFP